MSNKTTNAKISPIEIRPEMRLSIWSDQNLQKIHNATVTVLEETGVKFPSEKALDIFAEAGAHVDFETQIVKIPENILMSSIGKAPRAYTMASRTDPDLDLYLDGTKTYFGTDGTGTTTIDIETRTRRASTKRDVAMMALVSDFLPSISFYWPIVSAQDVPPQVMALHELEASFGSTEKHVHIVTCGKEKLANYAVEMATVIAGGSEGVKKRPPLTYCGTAISPLGQDKEGIEAALVFARAGLPVRFGTMPIMGSTAPASMGGTMVMGNAEVLSALCLVQIAYPGAPICYSFFPEMVNPHTGGCFVAAPQKSLLYATATQLAHYYGLPAMSYYGAAKSCEPWNWETGKDSAIDALMVLLSGPELIPNMGLLEDYTLLYPEKILFDNEIFCSLKVMTELFPLDADGLALEEIMAVGAGGHFLDRDHTCENVRRLWKPRITTEWSFQQGCFRDPREVALEKVKWILENHKPVPLDEVVKRELRRIVKAAEHELSG